jgi:hypothetical protein
LVQLLICNQLYQKYGLHFPRPKLLVEPNGHLTLKGVFPESNLSREKTAQIPELLRMTEIAPLVRAAADEIEVMVADISHPHVAPSSVPPNGHLPIRFSELVAPSGIADGVE